MVEVHIQHRDLAIALVTKSLSHDGGVVEETVPAEQIGMGVMSGWAAQGKGSALASGHQFLGGQGHIGGCPGGFPRTIRDRRLRREAVIAQPAVDVPGQPMAHAATRPDRRDGFTRFAGSQPFLPAGFQERHVIGGVYPFDGLQAIFFRFQNLSQRLFFHSCQDGFGTGRLLVRLDQQSAIQFGFDVSAAVQWREYGFHGLEWSLLNDVSTLAQGA